jgi:hypothetical protein
MIHDDLLDRLSERVEDPSTYGNNGTNYTRNELVNAVNNAQNIMVNLMDRRFFPTLQGNVTGVTEPFECSTSNLSGFTGRATDIYTIKVNGGKYCTIIEKENVSILDSIYTVGTTDAPVAWIDRNHIFVSPTSVSSIDVYYYKLPTDITDHQSNVFQFAGFEDIVLDLAEAELWKTDNKLQRSQTVYQTAIDHINVLNQKFADS